MTVRASRHENTITVKTTGVQKKWKLLIRDLSVTSVINGAAEALQEGTAIQPKEKDRDVFIFFLKGVIRMLKTVRTIMLAAMCTILSAAAVNPPPAAAKPRLMNMNIPFKIQVSLFKKGSATCFLD